LVNFEQPPSFNTSIGRRMINDISDYGRRCDEELAAADLAESKAARIENLEQAFRFAKKASPKRAAHVVSPHLSA
jgi:hypothetical protein